MYTIHFLKSHYFDYVILKSIRIQFFTIEKVVYIFVKSYLMFEYL